MNGLVSYCPISCSQTSSIIMSQCLFYMYSVNYNMKQRAFTLLDLVLWWRYSPVKLAPYTSITPIISSLFNSVVQSWPVLVLYLAYIASLNNSCGEESIRKSRSQFHSRCYTQLKRVVKTETLLYRIQHVHNKHVFTVLALIFVNKRQLFIQHKRWIKGGNITFKRF